MGKPKCPNCGSFWEGSVHSDRRYKCQVCGRHFRFPSLSRKSGFATRKRRVKTVENRVVRKKLGVDDLVGVPCFGCDMIGCNEIFCVRLGKWLLGIGSDSKEVVVC